MSISEEVLAAWKSTALRIEGDDFLCAQSPEDVGSVLGSRGFPAGLGLSI